MLNVNFRNTGNRKAGGDAKPPHAKDATGAKWMLPVGDEVTSLR